MLWIVWRWMFWIIAVLTFLVTGVASVVQLVAGEGPVLGRLGTVVMMWGGWVMSVVIGFAVLLGVSYVATMWGYPTPFWTFIPNAK